MTVRCFSSWFIVGRLDSSIFVVVRRGSSRFVGVGVAGPGPPVCHARRVCVSVSLCLLSFPYPCFHFHCKAQHFSPSDYHLPNSVEELTSSAVRSPPDYRLHPPPLSAAGVFSADEEGVRAPYGDDGHDWGVCHFG
jgi:hypothetical protein